MVDYILYLIALLFTVIVVSYALGSIAREIYNLTVAYRSRTVWLAEQAKSRAGAAAQRHQEQLEEGARKYWGALWEKLQQLQLEYLAWESKGDVAGINNLDKPLREHAYRLAARIALLWIRFAGVDFKYTNLLEGYPHGDGELTSTVSLILGYIERYMTAAGVTLSANLVRNRYGWLNKAAEALDQRLRDLNTPKDQPAKSGEGE